MRTFSYLTAAAVAVLLACVSMADEDKKESREFTTENPPAILTMVDGLMPVQIGQGTFRIRQFANGPIVAWAWRQSGAGTAYTEQWITHSNHVTPGDATNVKWIFAKVFDKTDASISTNSITFLNWVLAHGTTAGSGAPSRSELDKHYVHQVAVTQINPAINMKK